MKAHPQGDPVAIGQSITAAYTEARDGNNSAAFVLEPLKTVHLIAADGNKSGLRTVQIFGAIAVLLLVIGAVNYVNLSTAIAIDRVKEVGIRKVIGAGRTGLFVRFVLETVVVFAISLLIAVFLLFLLTPGYNEIARKSMHFPPGNGALWIYIGVAVFMTLCLASIYPALQLSAAQPIESLKGKTTGRLTSNTLRKVLVVFQFTIAVTLIISTLVIGNQLEFIQKINLGYEKDHVICLGLPGEAYNHTDAIRAELNGNPSIKGVSLTGIHNLTDYFHSTTDIEWPGKSKNNPLVVSQATIDKDFLPLMEIPLLAGSNFKGLPADSSHFIINKTLAIAMGLQPPYVGAQMSFHGVPGQIIGVVEDFHFKSIKEKIGPMVFWTRWGAGTLYVKTTAANAQQAIEALEAVYNRFPSDAPFSYTFIDAQFDNLYKSEKRTGVLFDIFSGIAIFLSALGLFALATHAAQTRIKEIGIRKVVGASVLSVTRLLCKDFIVLVCIAILIACPITVYLMQQWLADYAYRVELGAPTFVLGSSIAIAIAILTVSFQAIKAALANPVDSLRDE